MKSIRGFVFDSIKNLPPIIFTYEPKLLFRGGMEQEVTFLNDLEKASSISKNGFTRPVENFNIEPTLRDVYNYCKEAYESGEKQYCDIEAIGHLSNRDHNEITMIGLGRKSDNHVICIPFRVQGGGHYWEKEDEIKVRKYVRRVLRKSPMVFQNAEYDGKHLNYQKLGIVNVAGDTMLLHHALHPELPHSLDYITSIYGNIPYWKATLKKAKHQLEIPNEQFRTYNARDVLALMQIEQPLIDACKVAGTYKIYKKISIPMLNHVLYFNRKGVPVDAAKLVQWKAKLAHDNKKLLGTMLKNWSIHPLFNFDSRDQMSYLFYGQHPKSFEKKRQEFLEYDLPTCKKKKTTKKYKALLEYVEIYQQTEPFPKFPTLAVKVTKGGATATDDEMRVRIKETIVKRLAFLKGSLEKKVKQPNKDPMTLDQQLESEFVRGFVQEYKDLGNVLIVIDSLMEFAVNEKLISTYTKLHIEPDNRVHGGYKVHGTKTGRLSSYAPNMQNMPPAAKKIFIAPDGWKFVQFDFTNLELVVLAYLFDIAYLKNIFEQGLNVHDTNTETFLKITKEDKNWEIWRRVMKMYVFGRNYGGSLKGMYRRMLVGIPGLRMTFKELEELDKIYFDLQPEYRDGVDLTLDTLRRTRTLRNAFGRIRIFLGLIGKIEREGLNFPIQSTAADIMAFGIIRFMKMLKKAKKKGYKLYPCMTVHDSLVLIVPDEEIPIALRMLKKTMTAPLKIGKHNVQFGGEVKISQDYKGKKEDEKSLDDWINYYKK